MKSPEFESIIKETLARCLSTLAGKAKEYASDTDPLHNFHQAAHLQKTTPLKALGGMMAKHTISVYDMIASGGKYPFEL